MKNILSEILKIYQMVLRIDFPEARLLGMKITIETTPYIIQKEKKLTEH